MTTMLPGELSIRFPDILTCLKRGEDIVVAENGTPVARIVPHDFTGQNGFAMTVEQANAALFQLMIPGPAPGGTDNDSIDRDLMAEYSR